mgnify:CR=1 FL=1
MLLRHEGNLMFFSIPPVDRKFEFMVKWNLKFPIDMKGILCFSLYHLSIGNLRFHFTMNSLNSFDMAVKFSSTSQFHLRGVSHPG